MESRGKHEDGRSNGRLAIARRSCDQCRARKIGCDRGSPCSNCISARVNCTHSAIASNTTAPKQRVLISAQYEQKIDGIVRSVDSIKLLLEGLNVSSDTKQPEGLPIWHLNQVNSVGSLLEHRPVCESLWDHPVQIIDFVKAVVEDRGPRDAGPEESEVLSSLKSFVQTLEDPTAVRGLSSPFPEVVKYRTGPSMPPLEAVVAVLRWAKDHARYTRMVWVSQILPLEKFAEICRKIYFAVDDYSEVDLILANGYLSYVFSEHVIVSGRQDYREYFVLCQNNLHNALSRLPLLLPASMEVIAALTLGAFNAIENSKATMAWTFISTASDLCQRLGYHRLRSSRETDPSRRSAQESLFWTVHKHDKSLALRLGQPSNIRDAEITLPLNPDEPRPTRLARIQGKVYDQLYSPAGLSQLDAERGHRAEALAVELRGLIDETRAEISDATSQSSDGETDPMRVVYLQCELLCQSSLLALILRAVPTAGGSLILVSEDCLVVAREAMDVHHQCMMGVGGCKTDSSMVMKYINWAILHSPFVPFSILFTHAVQFSDYADVARLDRFAASLRYEDSAESATHPYRLYELLCQAARLYIESNNTSLPPDPTLIENLPDTLGQFDFAHFGAETGNTDGGDVRGFGLSDWYYSNQQIMNLLDEDVMF
ncbi:hypothetical protein F4776DRAFT_174560 [Hypoxylon sp. NC0597]|nr:hypothetical protein F4776DRAFT_174560 [Hypoxylon sp. NC0597]